PDVVLVEFGFHAVRVMDACYWAGVPMVVHFRGSDASADRRLGQLQERYRRLIKLAKAFVVKSKPMQQVLMGLGAPEQAITISPSGANPVLFHGGQPAQAPPQVLFVGRFVAKKAPLDALEAFVLARQQASPDLAAKMALVMVGDGPLLRDVEQRRQTLGLEHQVLLPGLQSAEQVAEWLRRSRCLLLPSRTAPDGDAEGCPVVVMEAQLAGVPVVSTFHAGIPEVVLDGQTGLLAAEGDLNGLAAALLNLLEAPQLAAEMGQAGCQWAAARFTVEHHVETLAAVLRRQARGIS
ncbi:MAG: glycosyltransferase, partial [Prochlorococcus sp.]